MRFPSYKRFLCLFEDQCNSLFVRHFQFGTMGFTDFKYHYFVSLYFRYHSTGPTGLPHFTNNLTAYVSYCFGCQKEKNLDYHYEVTYIFYMQTIKPTKENLNDLNDFLWLAVCSKILFPGMRFRISLPTLLLFSSLKPRSNFRRASSGVEGSHTVIK